MRGEETRQEKSKIDKEVYIPGQLDHRQMRALQVLSSKEESERD